MSDFKRITSIILLLIMILTAFPLSSINAFAKEPTTRVINLVYDDSGSMIETDNKEMVDTWCQAKYAMEVFAGMLGENDTMNIFYMSEYSKPLTLSGKDGIQQNIATVHKKVTTAGNTPFAAVTAAKNNLQKINANEKWLVILTDGEFQGVDDVEKELNNKPDNIKVMFLGMGPDAETIKSNEAKNIFFEKAPESTDILIKITGICNRIFNSDKIGKINPSRKTCDIDVPMGEFIVFAQGKDVKINGIKDDSGKEYKASAYEVKYSEKAALNSKYSEPRISENLVGKIAVFKDDFDVGRYTFDVSGADTLEVYYKPNVDVSAAVKDNNGKTVTNLTNLPAGTYEIEFFLVKKGENENENAKRFNSKLLGNIEYNATLTNGGETQEDINSGDKVKIKEGDLSINVLATYLGYHTVETDLSYSIFENKTITFSETSNPTYIVKKNSIENGTTPIRIKALIAGKEFTEEQWENFELSALNLEVQKPTKAQLGDFKIEKSDKLGELCIYPTLADEKTYPDLYDNAELSLNTNMKVGEETWSGDINISVNFDDQRCIFDIHGPTIIKIAICLAFFILILGYIPPFKKYLPKNLKERPIVVCKHAAIKIGTKKEYGQFSKDMYSTLIPYAAQRGTITYYPFGRGAGAPELKVKATKGKRMLITNKMAFKGKSVTIDGTPCEDIKRSIGSGVIIEYKTTKVKYKCIPNQ